MKIDEFDFDIYLNGELQCNKPGHFHSAAGLCGEVNVTDKKDTRPWVIINDEIRAVGLTREFLEQLYLDDLLQGGETVYRYIEDDTNYKDI